MRLAAVHHQHMAGRDLSGRPCVAGGRGRGTHPGGRGPRGRGCSASCGRSGYLAAAAAQQPHALVKVLRRPRLNSTVVSVAVETAQQVQGVGCQRGRGGGAHGRAGGFVSGPRVGGAWGRPASAGGGSARAAGASARRRSRRGLAGRAGPAETLDRDVAWLGKRATKIPRRCPRPGLARPEPPGVRPWTADAAPPSSRGLPSRPRCAPGKGRLRMAAIRCRTRTRPPAERAGVRRHRRWWASPGDLLHLPAMPPARPVSGWMTSTSSRARSVRARRRSCSCARPRPATRALSRMRW